MPLKKGKQKLVMPFRECYSKENLVKMIGFNNFYSIFIY